MPAVAVVMAENRLCIGVFAGAHGVRGDLRVKSFTADPDSLTAYGPLTDAGGTREFRLSVLGHVRGLLRVRVADVDSRDAAEALAGTELYIDRAALPEPDDSEYYHADLVGLRAELEDGTVFGTIKALFDFGAGEMLEITLASGGDVFLPFTTEAVPLVDIDGGRVVVRPPVEIEARGESTPPDEDGAP